MSEWIEWSGVGTLSAAQERLMDVRLRDGTHRYGISVSAWRWWHEGAPGDIMAYRIIEPKSDADGWIEWNGGICPVPPGATVRCRLRAGIETEGCLRNIGGHTRGLVPIFSPIASSSSRHPSSRSPRPASMPPWPSAVHVTEPSATMPASRSQSRQSSMVILAGIH